MNQIDQATIDLVDAMELISKAMNDPHRWSLRDSRKLKQAMGLIMEVTGELDKVEIGPTPASTWKKVTL